LTTSCSISGFQGLAANSRPCSDLAKFIAGGRIPCTIDRVNGKGIIETNRPDDKNKQYQDVVRQGDQLITKLQKYGQAVRLRGSERA
jgi:26S proteasome regulatory subunit N7